jgi:hypothetical protein
MEKNLILYIFVDLFILFKKFIAHIFPQIASRKAYCDYVCPFFY